MTQKINDLQEIWGMREEGDRMRNERAVAAKQSRVMRKCPGAEMVDARLAKMRQGVCMAINFVHTWHAGPVCDVFIEGFHVLFAVQATTSTADDSSSGTSGDSDVVVEPKGKEKCECTKDKVFVWWTGRNYFTLIQQEQMQMTLTHRG